MTSGASGLDAALKAAGIPIVGVSFNGATYTVQYQASATAAQISRGNNMASGWPTGNRSQRPLYAIYFDLQALTTAQQGAIWSDLSTTSVIGTYTVPKYLQDAGPNAGPIATLYWAAASSGASGASLTAAKLLIAAMYCQDNPRYLVSPTFSPAVSGVNVPGDQTTG